MCWTRLQNWSEMERTINHQLWLSTPEPKIKIGKPSLLINAQTEPTIQKPSIYWTTIGLFILPRTHIGLALPTQQISLAECCGQRRSLVTKLVNLSLTMTPLMPCSRIRSTSQTTEDGKQILRWKMATPPTVLDLELSLPHIRDPPPYLLQCTPCAFSRNPSF